MILLETASTFPLYILSLYPENTDIINNTIIDGSNEGVVINIQNIYDYDQYNTLEVNGFTISNGVGTGDCEIGEGIMSTTYDNKALIVQNCVMISNDADNCNISSTGDIILNKVTMRKLAIVGVGYFWNVIANNSIIYGGIVEPGVNYDHNIYDISYSLLPLFWEGEGNITANPSFCDALNGDLLWKFQMGTSARGQPITWEQGGKQYVAITSGGGGLAVEIVGEPPMVTRGNALMVFALPK